MVNHTIKHITCLYCSLGCRVALRAAGDNITAIDYDDYDPVNRGSLCPRGHYNFELINHPQRLTDAWVGKKKTSIEHAVKYINIKLKKADKGSIGIMVSCNSCSEDAYMAAQLARSLGTTNISPSGETFDIEAASVNRWIDQDPRLADVRKIGEFENLIIIGDLLTRSPVLSKRINQVKYGKRGNRITVIDPNVTHTTWFATTHLKNKPGTEALLMAGMLKSISGDTRPELSELDMKTVEEGTGIKASVIERIASEFDDMEKGCIIFVPGPHKKRNDLVQYFMDAMTVTSLGKKHITFFSFANTLGVSKVIDSEVPDHAGYNDIISGIENGKIKNLLIFGDESYSPSSELDLLVRTGYFKDGKEDPYTVLLPLASHIERKGTMNLAGSRYVSIIPIIHNVGSRSNWKFISNLMNDSRGFDEILDTTNNITIKRTETGKIDLRAKINELKSITSYGEVPVANVTHFGDNRHVSNYFWWRANNTGTVL
jgi:predicted molibdopterin-dependent oxidoreductase YjgC